MEKILLFLATMQCFPTIHIIEDIRTFYKEGIVYLSRPITDAKIVHELVHECQYQRENGPANNAIEWHQREQEAKLIEVLWLNHVAQEK